MTCFITKGMMAAVMAAATHAHLHTQPQQPVITPDSGTQAPNSNSSNPQISLISNFRANLINNDRSVHKEIALKEVELGIASDVDPFLKAEAYIAFANEDGTPIAEVEEAFGKYSNLGHGISAKFGKIAGAIGRIQRNHTDQLNFLDYPFIVQDFLGAEGLRAGGASISYLLPGNRFHELTLEGLDAADSKLFAGAHSGVPVWIGHYRTFIDFSEDKSAQLGATYANGPSGSNQRRAQLFGLDMAYKWMPGSAGKSMTLESEAYWGRPGTPGSKSAFGAFASTTYQLNHSLHGYIKYDYSEEPGTSKIRNAWSIGMTLKPTEFHHWRVEFQHSNSNFSSNKNVLNIQFQMAIGAHPAHKY